MLPKCIGFIMDGNRRWARERGFQSLEGHRQGYQAFKEVVLGLKEHGIPHGVFYAFSTENWNRTTEEVGFLMNLFEEMLSKLLSEEVTQDVRVRVVGQKYRFSENLQQLISEVEEKSREHTRTTIWIALSYGGRAEIIDAVNRAVAAGREVDETSFEELLWTAGMPDPELIIRTSGESRLSNFLPWQTVYSELFFIPTYWPDFGKEELGRILEEYGKREQRRGK